MVNFARNVLALCLVSSLVACGGSSSSGGNGKVNGGTDANNEHYISLSAIKYNSCTERPYSDLDIVFHGSDGKPVKSTKTNVQGAFYGPLPDGAKHVSLVAQNPAQIFTYLDVTPGTNLSRLYLADNTEACVCRDVEVDFSDAAWAVDYFDVLDENMNSLDFPYTTKSATVEVCPSESEIYFLARNYSTQQALAAKIDVPLGVDKVSVNSSDFSHVGVKVASPELEPGHYWQYSYAADESQRMVFANWGDDAYIFPTMLKTNIVQRSHYSSESIANTTVSLSAISAAVIDENGNVANNPVPNLDMSLFQSFVGQSSPQRMAYDFTGIDPRFAMTGWRFEFRDNDGNLNSWRIYTALKDEIPDLSFGDVYPEPVGDVSLESFRIYLYGYEGAPTELNAYRKFISNKPEKSVYSSERYQKPVWGLVNVRVQ
ncbi:hypothetical protein HG263_12900 [Pseudoalteromonas sp. JBTF-M23]|uniref:DUF4842 domain-containing protein n=1 Tax=Pseudoalteromonas caenipelagi TaxID=2726988 RepID=A0A849VF96_9GAMM|nr:hypothetical protein [Pseudoalteromonas caenipelagi]NOU51428.1 hypothetical protein [Pseudoalteromonas caenipelagi]